MTDDDELRRLFQDAEPAEQPADPDALVDSLMARIAAATGSADAQEPGEEAAGETAADAPAASRWRTLALYGAGAVAVIILAVTLYACGRAEEPAPLASPSPTATPSVTPSATPSPSTTPSPSASAVPTPSPSVTPSPERGPEQPEPEAPAPPDPAPDPDPEPEPAPPADETAPRIRLTSAIDDIWEVNDMCDPQALTIRATIIDDVGVDSAGIRYVAGSAAPAQRALARGAGDEFTGTVGPIEAGSVAEQLQPTNVEVELWARDAAMNIATVRVTVPVRSSWACAPG